jgi:hypothetical protein
MSYLQGNQWFWWSLWKAISDLIDIKNDIGRVHIVIVYWSENVTLLFVK